MPIPFHTPFTSGLEASRVQEAIKTGQFGVRTPYTHEAVSALEELIGNGRRVLLTHSCTGALELMALALELEPGDEIIVPSYTFTSTAAAFIRANGRVRFADVDPATLTLDPTSVEQLLNDKTRAVVAVHYAGLPGRFEEIANLLEDHSAVLLEDAAQALGVESRSGMLGGIGQMGAISFHFTKNIHCGFGGALILGPQIDYQAVEHSWERGTNRANLVHGQVDRYTWVTLGSSFSMDGIHAAFLSEQLRHHADVGRKRGEIFEVYRDRMDELGSVNLIGPNDDVLTWNHHAAVTVFEDARTTEHVRQSLSDDQISAYIGYVPLHDSPFGSTLGDYLLPVTTNVAPRVLRLPIHTAMTPEDASTVCDSVERALDRYEYEQA